MDEKFAEVLYLADPCKEPHPNGYCDRDAFDSIACKQRFPGIQVQQMMTEADTDKSGEIDFKELQKMLKPPPSQTTKKLMKKGAAAAVADRPGSGDSKSRPGSGKPGGAAGFLSVIDQAKAAAGK